MQEFSEGFDSKVFMPRLIIEKFIIFVDLLNGGDGSGMILRNTQQFRCTIIILHNYYWQISWKYIDLDVLINKVRSIWSCVCSCSL